MQLSIVNFSKKLDYENNSLHEIEIAKGQIEHKEPILVGFFILQYAKLRLIELYYFYFIKFCDANKFEKLKFVVCWEYTGFLYLVFAERELEDCIRREGKQSEISCN